LNRRQQIDEMLNKMVTTGELQKLYKQGATKLYGRDLTSSESVQDDEGLVAEDKPS
jgi:hypothetical protein